MAMEMELGTRPYRETNQEIRDAIAAGEKDFVLEKVLGQRYIGCGAPAGISFAIHGTPGNDMSAYMDGASVEVFGNGQDQIGNTMNDGTIVVHGHVGDAAGYAMRGGEIFIRDYCGWRVGIHMKQYRQKRPVVVIGGDAGSFLGEYMAGGVLLVLGRGLPPGATHPARYVGTGMHGGVIYLRGQPNQPFLGKEVGLAPITDADRALIGELVARYNTLFGLQVSAEDEFVKLIPQSKRPYGQIYAY